MWQGKGACDIFHEFLYRNFVFGVRELRSEKIKPKRLGSFSPV